MSPWPFRAPDHHRLQVAYWQGVADGVGAAQAQIREALAESSRPPLIDPEHYAAQVKASREGRQ